MTTPSPIVGPYGVGRSLNYEDSRSINLYTEVSETKQGKSQMALYEAPGLTYLVTAGGGPIRGMISGGPGLGFFVYVVSGNSVFRIDRGFLGNPTPPPVTQLTGTLQTSSGPVSMIINTTGQVMIVDGVAGYVINGNTVAPPAGSFFTAPGVATYQDTFGLVNDRFTNIIWQSKAGTFDHWGALLFTNADAQPDNVISLASLNRLIWVMSSYHTAIYQDAGTSGFAFQRVDGVFIETGCLAPYSLAKGGETLIWLGQNSQGEGYIVQTQGLNVTRISTHPIEALIQSFGFISDAIGYCYQQQGHVFYVLTFPAANATLCYDLTTSQLVGSPQWSIRAEFLNGSWNRHWSNCFCNFGYQEFGYRGLLMVGDYRNGNIYQYDLSNGTDNGSQRKWLRSWRALQSPMFSPRPFKQLRLDTQTGIGVPDGENPQYMMRWSDDGGHNWSDYRIKAAGETGQTHRNVTFKALGSTRRNHGLDRIFELSSTDVWGVGIMGATVEP